jgi:signal peptidase I
VGAAPRVAGTGLIGDSVRLAMSSKTPDRAPGTVGRPARGQSVWLWLAVAVLIGGAIALLARAEGVHPVKIVSGSMVPTIEIGDRVVVRDLDQGARSEIDRGEIVLFRFPLGTTGRAVKRVVAVGGDRVAISARSVTVNGHLIRIAGAPSANAARARVETVPDGGVFLLGDNAAVSIDSRSLGPVPETELVGDVLFVIPTPGRLLLAALAAAALLLCGLSLVISRRRR